MNWWSMRRGPEREKAKAAFCTAHPLLNDDGGPDADEPQYKSANTALPKSFSPTAAAPFAKAKNCGFRNEAEERLQEIMLKANLPGVPAKLVYTEKGGKLFACGHELFTDTTRAFQRKFARIAKSNQGETAANQQPRE